jgi:hypothetical protein
MIHPDRWIAECSPLRMDGRRRLQGNAKMSDVWKVGDSTLGSVQDDRIVGIAHCCARHCDGGSYPHSPTELHKDFLTGWDHDPYECRRHPTPSSDSR